MARMTIGAAELEPAPSVLGRSIEVLNIVGAGFAPIWI